MLQLLQNLRSGETLLADVPAPLVVPGSLLVATSCSLISSGTERMLVEFGRASLIEKARQEPEKASLVWDKVRTDGLLATLDAVRSKLDQPLTLGYSNVGTVLEVGQGVQGVVAGDRVVSNGPHAELVLVPQNLCARVPDSVDDETAVFTVLASIALQGVRLSAPTLGEYVVVMGLGSIGLITVQLLRACGCNVLGIDPDESRLHLARQFGAEVSDVARGENLLDRCSAFTKGRGADAVIVTASTESNEPISQAARFCRKRGRIVLVGVTGLKLNRADFYEKELTFQVSCSYGPGRYDPEYESEGHDYPIGFVRWTAGRNFEAVLAMMSCGSLDVRPLVSHRFGMSSATQAYETLLRGRGGLGILLTYDTAEPSLALRATSTPLPGALFKSARRQTESREPTIAVVGAGNFGSRVMLPALKKCGVNLDTLVTSRGVSALYHGRKTGFSFACTDFEEGVIANPRINAVAIASRHDTHARLAAASLQAGLHVFVEKPLALTEESLVEVEKQASAQCDGTPAPLLMVGFNRRFSPLIEKMKSLLARVAAPKCFVYTVSAGAIPPDHWTQQRSVGGGRILGEACHFIDLLRHLAGCPITDGEIVTMGANSAVILREDKASIALRFADGSIGSIHYFANGGKRFPKERLEVFCNDGVLALENFVRLSAFDWRGFSGMRLWRQDKGHLTCLKAFVAAVRNGGPSPIPLDELMEVSRLSIRLATAQNDR